MEQMTLAASPERRYRCSYHLTDEKTEAPGGEVTRLSSCGPTAELTKAWVSSAPRLQARSPPGFLGTRLANHTGTATNRFVRPWLLAPPEGTRASEDWQLVSYLVTGTDSPVLGEEGAPTVPSSCKAPSIPQSSFDDANRAIGKTE